VIERISIRNNHPFKDIETISKTFVNYLSSNTVAKVIYELSSNYQIFAINYQPQLSSYANKHYIVSKDSKDITKEAREFAKKLLKERV
jgi:hypothetical protein